MKFSRKFVSIVFAFRQRGRMCQGLIGNLVLSSGTSLAARKEEHNDIRWSAYNKSVPYAVYGKPVPECVRMNVVVYQLYKPV